MRRQLLVVSEKKIKMLKTAFAQIKKLSIIGGATIFFAHNVCTYQIYVYNKGLITSILWELCAGRWTQDPQHHTISSQVS